MRGYISLSHHIELIRQVNKILKCYVDLYLQSFFIFIVYNIKWHASYSDYYVKGSVVIRSFRNLLMGLPLRCFKVQQWHTPSSCPVVTVCCHCPPPSEAPSLPDRGNACYRILGYIPAWLGQSTLICLLCLMACLGQRNNEIKPSFLLCFEYYKHCGCNTLNGPPCRGRRSGGGGVTGF